MRYAILGLLAVLSWPAQAITYQFQTDSVFGDDPNFNAVLQLSEPSSFSAEASTLQQVPGSTQFVSIDTTGSFQSFSMSYTFAGNLVALHLAPELFTPSFVAVDNIQIFGSIPGSPAGLFQANFSEGVSGSSPNGLLGLWSLQFGSDDQNFLPSTITGTFVAVPEPSTIFILLIGAAICFGAASAQRARA